MRDPTPPPSPPRRAPAGLRAGGLLLLVAGVAVLAWVLVSAAGLVGEDDPTRVDAPGTAARR